MLQAKGIHFCIRHQPIVEQADFFLHPGELTVILGPNGAGKSTLFRILSGDLPCRRGTVQYNGSQIKSLKPAQLAEIRAVMPQHTFLTFPFRAYEVVALGMLKSKNSNPRQIVEEVMRETQTWLLKDRFYGDLSGGEKQRVQLARVLTQIWETKSFPRYLLLDEPTSSMDIAQQHLVLQIVQKLKKRNIGVVTILHDLNLAANYADRIVLLKNGTVRKEGITREVMTSENLGNVFGHPIRVFSEGPDSPIYINSLPIDIKNQSQFKIA